jgi:hypothetical protein
MKDNAEGWLAVEHKTNVYGLGADPFESVHNLRRELISYRDALRAESHRLGPALQGDLDYLETMHL